MKAERGIMVAIGKTDLESLAAGIVSEEMRSRCGRALGALELELSLEARQPELFEWRDTREAVDVR